MKLMSDNNDSDSVISPPLTSIPFETGPPLLVCPDGYVHHWVPGIGEQQDQQICLPAGVPPGTGGIKPIPGRMIEPLPIVTNPILTTRTPRQQAEPFTILGLNPLAALALAAGGLFLIVSATGETKAKRGDA